MDVQHLFKYLFRHRPPLLDSLGLPEASSALVVDYLMRRPPFYSNPIDALRTNREQCLVKINHTIYWRWLVLSGLCADVQGFEGRDCVGASFKMCRIQITPLAFILVVILMRRVCAGH